MVFPANRLPRRVTIEWTDSGRTMRRTFSSSKQAKKFYEGKCKEGAQPRIVETETIYKPVSDNPKLPSDEPPF